MSKVRSWLKAARLRTLPLAIACVGLGSFLAASDGSFRWLILVLSLLTTLCLQILSNLANDFGDSQHGADHPLRRGPARTVQSGLITSAEMRKGIVLFVALSLIAGIALIAYSLGWGNTKFVLFLALGLLAILAALKYTVGSRPYGYAGLGDIAVLAFFGLIGVMGTYYLHAHRLQAIHLLPALSSGFLATGVLNINNIRDLESDRIAGKKSVPVRIGLQRSALYHWFLLGSAFLSAMAFASLQFSRPVQWLFTLLLPLLIYNGQAIARYSTDPSLPLDPFLKQLALTSLLFLFALGFGILL